MGSDPRSRVSARELEELAVFQNVLAEEGRAVLKEIGEDLRTTAKADKSLVTAVDREIERRCRELIESRYPQHGVLGEEFGESNPGAEFCWILDPIDGTEEFVAGTPLFGSIIGLHLESRPLAALTDHPLLKLRVSAEFGRGMKKNGEPLKRGRQNYPSPRVASANRGNFLRSGDQSAVFDAITAQYPNVRIYSSCYAHTCTALGGFDAMVEWNVKVWDLASAELLITEAGGMYADVTPAASAAAGLICAVFGDPSRVTQICSLLEE